jgi:hypothetical protein
VVGRVTRVGQVVERRAVHLLLHGLDHALVDDVRREFRWGLFEHGTDYVALWLVHGFLKWVDAIVDLVEDYIDSHWDD